MQSFQEFNTEGKKGRYPKKMKVTNSWGVYDAYKAIRKNHWFDVGRPITEKEFYAIIRGINKLLAEEIVSGNSITFPERMGKLEMRKYEKGVKLVNGKLKNTYPIDWAKTWRLWYEDKEAYDKKIILRDEQPFVYHIKYCKEDATYENKVFYQFDLNRFIKVGLKDSIKAGKIDTLWTS